MLINPNKLGDQMSLTPQQAINQNCKDCIYDPAEPGYWQQQVEQCQSEGACALWHLRPLTGAGKIARKVAKYNAMTPAQQAVYKKRADIARKNLRA